MGKKNRKKKSGAPASSQSGLPKVDLDSIDNSVCALCKKEIDIFHWDFLNRTYFYECCGHSICTDCKDLTRKKRKDEVAQLAKLVLNVGPSTLSPSTLPLLSKKAEPSCPMCGTVVAQSSADIRSRMRRLAEAGHVHAQYLLANELASTQAGHRKDPKAIVKWLKRAAEGGDTYACARMGDRYYDGEDVVQSYEQAKLWYERSGTHAMALHGLGMIYKYGKGVEKDGEKAREYFRQAAEQDYPEALADYGLSLYSEGQFEEALVPFEKCARMEEQLGRNRHIISTSQLTTSKILMKIRKPFTSSANNPYPPALFWLRRAAKNGHEEAKKDLETIEFAAHLFCSSCGKLNPKNKCTKCRAVSYCDKVRDDEVP
jgi:hypothetical protein